MFFAFEKLKKKKQKAKEPHHSSWEYVTINKHICTKQWLRHNIKRKKIIIWDLRNKMVDYL